MDKMGNGFQKLNGLVMYYNSISALKFLYNSSLTKMIGNALTNENREETESIEKRQDDSQAWGFQDSIENVRVCEKSKNLLWIMNH